MQVLFTAKAAKKIAEASENAIENSIASFSKVRSSYEESYNRDGSDTSLSFNKKSEGYCRIRLP